MNSNSTFANEIIDKFPDWFTDDIHQARLNGTSPKINSNFNMDMPPDKRYGAAKSNNKHNANKKKAPKNV